jgi:hypothetical protein
MGRSGNRALPAMSDFEVVRPRNHDPGLRMISDPFS